MKRKVLLVMAAVGVATPAFADCDKLSIVDAKALTQEQLKGRICRDMAKRNVYVDLANSFLTHTDMFITYKGINLVDRRNAQFYFGWLGELKQAGVCDEAVKSNTETYTESYGASPGCEAPHMAQRLDLAPY